MLRGVLPILRTLRARRPLATSAQATRDAKRPDASAATTVVAAGTVEERQFRDGGLRRDDRQRRAQLPDEHTQLLRRHGDAIENSQVQTLADAVERVEWYTLVSPRTLEKIAGLLLRAEESELSSLSDRSLATLISSFGEHCEETQPATKTRMLEEVVEAIGKKGVKLGPQARCALFAVRVHNAPRDALPSVVDEVAAWDEAGLPLTEDVVVEMARAYAYQADRKGVLELTTYAKEEFGRIDVRLMEWLSYAMMAGTEPGGTGALEKLAASATPDVALRMWCRAALAVAEHRGDVQAVISLLSRVPLGARLDFSDNNGPAVDVLLALIDRGVEGVEEKLAPYLALAGDQSRTLHEKHAKNGVLQARANRAVGAKEPEKAVRFYSLVNGKNRSSYTAKGIRFAVVQSASGDAAAARRIAARMQAAGIVEDASSFLLTVFRGPALHPIVAELRESGRLLSTIDASEHVNRFTVAQRLVDGVSKAELPRALLLASVVLQVPEPVEGMDGIELNNRRTATERKLFALAGKDPSVVCSALQYMAQSGDAEAEKLAGNLATSALSQVLLENDVLVSARIDTLLKSQHIPFVRIGRLQPLLHRILLQARTPEDEKRAIEIVTGVLGLKAAGDYTSRAIASLLANPAIRDGRIAALASHLATKPSIGIRSELVEETKKSLTKAGLNGRAELVDNLRLKSQAYHRWLASSLADLEMLHSRIEGDLEAEREVEDVEIEEGENSEKRAKVDGRKDEKTVKTMRILATIRRIMMDKMVEEKVTGNGALFLLSRCIPMIKDKRIFENTRSDLLTSSERLLRAALDHCAMAGEWDTVVKLWEIRGPCKHLPVSAQLALAWHHVRDGRADAAARVVDALRASGAGVRPPDVARLGEMLSGEREEGRKACARWLHEELRVDEKTVARLEMACAQRRLEELIESGKLPEALQYANEQTAALGMAFGHFELMTEAIRKQNRDVIAAAIQMVASVHSQPTALLDLAYVFLQEGRRGDAEKLVKLDGMLISSSKLRFYAARALGKNRPDIIHSLLSILLSCPNLADKVPESDVNATALRLAAYYASAGRTDDLRALAEDVACSQLTMEAPLRQIVERHTEKAERWSAV